MTGESYARYFDEGVKEYWDSRGLSPDTVETFKLGYYVPLKRFTIPYMGADDRISNISFRASMEEQTPKYIRLPGVPNQYFIIQAATNTEGLPQVVLAEGEIDSISLRQAGLCQTIIGLPGGGFINDSLAEAIPAGTRVSAILHSDSVGKRGRTKLRQRIPNLRVIDLPEGIKDINELLVRDGNEAVVALLNSAGESVQESHNRDDENADRERSTPVRSTVYITIPDDHGDWLIQDLWADKALGFIAGIPKVMKSMLALHIGYSVAEGKPFVGKSILNPGPVILFQEEDNDRLIKSRIRLINGGLGSDNLYLVTPGISSTHLRLDSDDSLQALDEAVETLKPVLVILDPLANMHSLEDENQAGPMNKMLERLRWMRDLRKCSFMIVHHMRKGGDDRAGQAMRGSSVLHAKAESALYIERYGKLLRIQVENKMAPNRVLEVSFDGKQFIYQDETGEAITDDNA